MIDTDVERAARFWYLACEAIYNTMPQASLQKHPSGVRVLTTGARASILNGIISTTHEPDPDEMRALATSYSGSALRWSIQLRDDSASPAVAELANRCGLTASSVAPFMIKRLVQSGMREPRSAATRIRRVPKEDHETFRSVLAAGFESPEEIFKPFASPELLDAKGITAFLVEEAGERVATSLGILVGDHVGVFSVSTLPQHRRRGFGRVATTAVIQDAYARGARVAFLKSSPQGKPLYESLGFVTVENWRTYVAP
jgi:GNAT superfamily N-acetyltransferase